MDEFQDLQRRQMHHDQTCHQDIVILPPKARLTHLALHFAKYVGRLSEVGEALTEDAFRRTLADTFIVALSALGVLGTDFKRLMRSECPGLDAPTLSDAGRYLDRLLARHQGASEARPFLFRELAFETGRLAKGLEDHDHDPRRHLSDQVKPAFEHIAMSAMVAAIRAQLDLGRLVRDRWEEVAARAPVSR